MMRAMTVEGEESIEGMMAAVGGILLLYTYTLHERTSANRREMED